MRFSAVLFDCDGVLVDSEPITNGVLRDMLEEGGWSLTPAECMRIFVGKAVRDERVLIEMQTGQPLTEEWMARFYARRNQRLLAELLPIPGAVPSVATLHTSLNGQLACASGADLAKVLLQLDMVGLSRYFGKAVFSGHDLPRSKPAPDVYLAAAAHLAVPPAQCLVVEDTPTGVTAGVAAGATVWAYCPDQAHGLALLQAGAQRLFTDMALLPALVAES
jgi:HAD superfamily hydrolase (TIGR01509 family)